MISALRVNGKIVWDPSWKIAPLLLQFPICPNDFSRCGQTENPKIILARVKENEL